MRSLTGRFLLALGAILGVTNALFEDQAFKFDWRQRYVGVPFRSGFLNADSTGKSNKLILATESGVLSVLDANTGAIKWRHQLTGNDADAKLMDFSLSASGKRASTLISTTGNERTELFAQTWNPNNGLMSQELAAVLPADLPRPDWGLLLGNEIGAIYRQGASLKVHAFDAKTGASLRTNSFTLGSQDPNIQCHKTNSVFACVSLEQNMLYYFRLPAEKGDAISAVSLGAMGLGNPLSVTRIGVIPLRDAIQIETPENALILNFNKGKFTGSHAIPFVTTSGSGDDATGGLSVLTGCEQGLLSVRQSGKVLKVTALTDEGLTLTDKKVVEVKIGAAGRGKLVAASGTCGGLKTFNRLMVQFEDGSVCSVSDGGDVFWTREEGLAAIEDVQLVDTGDHAVFDDEAVAAGAGNAGADYHAVGGGEALYSETEKKTDALTQFLKRVKYHATQLNAYITHLIAAKDLRSLLRIHGSNKDEFGIRKMVVAVTSKAKVYGLDSKTGKVMWSFMLPGGIAYSATNPPKIFVQRSAHHFGMDPICALVYKANSKMINILTFNPLNGKVKSAADDVTNNTDDVITQPRTVGMSYVKAFLLHHSNEDLIRPLVILTKSNQLVIEPEEDAKLLKSLAGKMFIAAVDPTNEERILGQRVVVNAEGSLQLNTMWSLSSPGAKIVNLIGKPTDQPVHSQGRVMADRSVLFKYINPNLGFVLAEGKDASSKTFVNIYLVDLVTGRVVFSATHKRVHGPYHVVHSENWAVYTYYNEKSRRAELASLELYEGKSQSNSTVFSSLHNVVNPLVERQSFILGPSFVTSLRDTLTEKGITTKHILMSTSTGAIFDIPRQLLDPRRPNVNTPMDQREPGLPPYIPELVLAPEAILNYNQTVLSVRGIATAATGLESTSVVFVHGLDLYCTSVAPSKGFDLLKDDFDYYVISSVLMALIGAAFVTKRLAQRKALIQAWR